MPWDSRPAGDALGHTGRCRGRPVLRQTGHIEAGDTLGGRTHLGDVEAGGTLGLTAFWGRRDAKADGALGQH
eukprot:6206948-Pleurochrysis_carterae.AAC.3